MINRHIQNRALSLIDWLDFDYHAIKRIKAPKKIAFGNFDYRKINRFNVLKSFLDENNKSTCWVYQQIIPMFARVPFIKAEQIEWWLTQAKGQKLSAHDYHEMHLILKALRFLRVIKKYEYQVQSQTQIAYVMVARQLYQQLLPQRELTLLDESSEQLMQGIPQFNRRMIYNWENATRIYNNLLANHFWVRLKNFANNIPILFFKDGEYIYGLLVTHTSDSVSMGIDTDEELEPEETSVMQYWNTIQASQFESQTDIPLFITFYSNDVWLTQSDMRALRIIPYSILRRDDFKTIFSQFDFQQWKQARLQAEYRQQHPFLSKFHPFHPC